MSGALREYKKQPKTVNEQIELIIARGLVVSDENELRHYLSNISYYHLSIYFKYFQKGNCFYNSATFEDVLRIYNFYNKLRFLLLELLERIEKSFKCRLAYEISIESRSAHWYLDKNWFINEVKYKEVSEIINKEISKSREESILHYKNTYDYPTMPPIWNIVEIISFGQCVKFYSSLKRGYKNKIARTYSEDAKFIENWMYCLSLLRNNCAHHSRLWNKRFNFTLIKKHKKYTDYYPTNYSNRIFDYLIVLQIILSKINNNSNWLNRLTNLINEYKIDVSRMGFPTDWKCKLESIK